MSKPLICGSDGVGARCAGCRGVCRVQVSPAPSRHWHRCPWPRRAFPRLGQCLDLYCCAFHLRESSGAAATRSHCRKGSELPRADRSISDPGYKHAACALSPQFGSLDSTCWGLPGAEPVWFVSARLSWRGCRAGRAARVRGREARPCPGQGVSAGAVGNCGSPLRRAHLAQLRWLGLAPPRCCSDSPAARPGRAGPGRCGHRGDGAGVRDGAGPPAVSPGTAPVRHSPCPPASRASPGKMHHFRGAAELTMFIPPFAASVFGKSNLSVCTMKYNSAVCGPGWEDAPSRESLLAVRGPSPCPGEGFGGRAVRGSSRPRSPAPARERKRCLAVGTAQCRQPVV